MLMPFEMDTSIFFGGSHLNNDVYISLLSPFLAQYPSLWQSFTAGKIGRSEIIAHGTTIDPLLYTSMDFYPHTPSLGCLCSPEIWDSMGLRLNSIQHNWVSIVKALTQAPNYLIVAEVADFNISYGK